MLPTDVCGWHIGRANAFRLKGHGMKFQHNIRAVSGAPLSTVVVDLKRHFRTSMNEWMNEWEGLNVAVLIFITYFVLVDIADIPPKIVARDFVKMD